MTTLTEDHVRIAPAATGMGLFAAKHIPAGTVILEYVGRVITPSEGDESDSRFIFAVSEGKDIDGDVPWNTARYMNHSCDPNAESEEFDERIFIRAVREILPGEEITFDYGKEYFDEFIAPTGCRCSACTPKK